MPLFFFRPRTHVRWHHKALTASFADASPAMVWRWNQDELPASFALRPENGQLHLVQSGRSGGETTIAVFSSASAAEQALDRLSRGLFGPSSAWWRIGGRIIVGLFAVFGVLAAILWISMQIGSPLQQAGHQAAAIRAAQTALAAMPTQTGSGGIPGIPGPTAPAPVTPQPGTPVDVDQVYK